MKFHPPSFVMGVAGAAAVVASAKRLRPVIVEIASLGLHFARLGRAVIERQRESAEDLWAEVEDKARQRGRARRRDTGRRQGDGTPAAPQTTH
jgi:hypothetical protein